MSIKDDLKAYIDGELTPSREAEVRQALDADPALQAEVVEMRQMSQVIREGSFQPEPAGLESTLLALEAARRKQAAPRFLSQRLAWGMGLAGTLVLAVLLVPRLTPSSSEEAASTLSRAAATPESAVGSIPELKGEMEKGRTLPPAVDVHDRTRGGRRFGEEGDSPMTGDAAAKAKKSVGGMAGLDNSRSFERQQTPEHTAGGPAPVQRQLSLEVRNAELAVEVFDVSAAQRQATNVAAALGGRVDTSGVTSSGGLATADVVIRVPVRQFESAMARLRSLGRVTNEGMSAEDVTAQVADTEARLRVLRAEEDQDVALMKKSRTISDTLQVKDRLTEIRQEIESLDAQRKVLRDQAAMSTITVHLTQKREVPTVRRPAGWFQTVWSGAWDGLVDIGRAIAMVGVYLFVFAPVWIPISGLGLWLYRRQRAV